MYYIYILECVNGSLYTGYTNDIEKRYSKHLEGKGAKYTRSNPPKKIATYWKINGSMSLAMQIEAYIKKLSRADKIKLIQSPKSLRKRLLEGQYILNGVRLYGK